jgi:hypothetical protein
MALRFNLFHEIEKQRAASRRDPLKISFFILGGIIACFAAYYFWNLTICLQATGEMKRRKAEFNALETQVKTAKKTEPELQKKIKASDSLLKRIEGRFYWAPLLEQVIALIPPEVQISRLSGDVQQVMTIDKKAGNVPRSSFKTTNLTLDGVAAGNEPRSVADDLRKAIIASLSNKYRNVNTPIQGGFVIEPESPDILLNGQNTHTAQFQMKIQFQSGEGRGHAAAPRSENETVAQHMPLQNE